MSQAVVADQSITAWLDEVIEVHGTAKSALIPILQETQKKLNYLPQHALAHIAQTLNVPPATVYGVATFYAQFSLEPKGKYTIKVCDGTACHVRRSNPVYEALRKRVKLAEGKHTTADLRYTVETVSCLGACGLAPVITINDQVYGQMTPEAVNIIIDELEKTDGEFGNVQ